MSVITIIVSFYCFLALIWFVCHYNTFSILISTFLSSPTFWLAIQQSTIYYPGLLSWWDQTTRWPSFWCSKYFFFTVFYRLRTLKTLYFHICNFIKNNKRINWNHFCNEFCKKLWKKILETSDTLSSNHLSQRTSKTSVSYCRLLNL